MESEKTNGTKIGGTAELPLSQFLEMRDEIARLREELADSKKAYEDILESKLRILRPLLREAESLGVAPEQIERANVTATSLNKTFERGVDIALIFEIRGDSK